MKYEFATISCPGTREINEDAVEVAGKGGNYIMVVADGLGGHEKGEVASALVSKVITEQIEFKENQEEELGNALRMAQSCLLQRQKEENAVNAMKTTAVALSLKDDKAYLAYVGDSRGYVFFKHKKYIRTLDHSVPQMLALAGDIKEKEIRYHQDRSSLLRVFGTEWEKDAYEILEEIKAKEVKAFLLCSDGFWELITERQMQWCLLWSKSPQEWLRRMVKMIEKSGAGKEMDNYTAGAVFVKEG